MKLRDVIALPFLFIALICDTLAIRIGGEWTTKTYLHPLQNRK